MCRAGRPLNTHVKALLADIGWTTAQWARDADVRETTAARWLSGARPVPPAEMARLVRLAEAHRSNRAVKPGG